MKLGSYCITVLHSTIAFWILISFILFLHSNCNWRKLLSFHDPAALARVDDLMIGHKKKEAELYKYLKSVYEDPPKQKCEYPTIRSEDDILKENHVRSSIRFIKSKRPEHTQGNKGNTSDYIDREYIGKRNVYKSDEAIIGCSTVPNVVPSTHSSSQMFKKATHTPSQRRSFKSRISKKHETVKMIRSILEERSPSMYKYVDRMLRDHLGQEDELLDNLILEFGLSEKRDLLDTKHRTALMENYDKSFEIQYNSSGSSDCEFQMNVNSSVSSLEKSTGLAPDKGRKLTYYKDSNMTPSPRKSRKGSFHESPQPRNASFPGNNGVIVPRHSRAQSFTSYTCPTSRTSTSTSTLPVVLPSPMAHYPHNSPPSEIPPHPSPSTPHRSFSFNPTYDKFSIISPVRAEDHNSPKQFPDSTRSTLSRLFPTASPSLSGDSSLLNTPIDSPRTPYRPVEDCSPSQIYAHALDRSDQYDMPMVTLKLPINRSSHSRVSPNVTPTTPPRGTSPLSPPLPLPPSPVRFSQSPPKVGICPPPPIRLPTGSTPPHTARSDRSDRSEPSLTQIVERTQKMAIASPVTSDECV